MVLWRGTPLRFVIADPGRLYGLRSPKIGKVIQASTGCKPVPGQCMQSRASLNLHNIKTYVCALTNLVRTEQSHKLCFRPSTQSRFHTIDFSQTWLKLTIQEPWTKADLWQILFLWIYKTEEKDLNLLHMLCKRSFTTVPAVRFTGQSDDRNAEGIGLRSSGECKIYETQEVYTIIFVYMTCTNDII